MAMDRVRKLSIQENPLWPTVSKLHSVKSMDCDVITFSRVVQTHLRLCNRFNALHREITEKKANGTFQGGRFSNIYDYQRPFDYKLAPIFPALAIVIKDSQEKHDYWSETEKHDDWTEMKSYERGQEISANLVPMGSNE